MPALGFDGAQGDKDHVRIAMITFASDNGQLIRWLKKRGQCIKDEDWCGLGKCNEFITKQLKNDKDLLEKLQRPCTAFVTFETEEGFHRALNYNHVIDTIAEYEPYTELLGQKVVIKDASEPSDIIWENRSFTQLERQMKKLTVMTIILFLLFISFLFIYLLQKLSLDIMNKYPHANCQATSLDFKNKIT